MKALLLAAGLGKRLRPLTNMLPQCLIPINGRPLLEYWFRYLSDAGISKILTNLHYLHEIVEQFVCENSFGLKVSTVYEEKLLGTGGTILHNRDYFANEPFMLINADNLCFCNFHNFIKAHQKRPSGTEITMMTFTTPTPQTCGIVTLHKNGIVRKIYEKVAHPPGNLANAAIYIIEPSVIDFLIDFKTNVIDFSTEVLPHYLGRIYTYYNKTYHRDLGNIGSYSAAHAEFSETLILSRNYDPWEEFCGIGKICNASNIAITLAKALESELVPLVTNSPCQILSGINIKPEITKSVMMVADKPPFDIDFWIKCAKAKYGSDKTLFILFHLVPIGFCAKKIFKRTGIVSFAISTSRLL